MCIHGHVECGMIDNGDSKGWEGGKEVDDESLLNGYNVIMWVMDTLKVLTSLLCNLCMW